MLWLLYWRIGFASRFSVFPFLFFFLRPTTSLRNYTVIQYKRIRESTRRQRAPSAFRRDGDFGNVAFDGGIKHVFCKRFPRTFRFERFVRTRYRLLRNAHVVRRPVSNSANANGTKTGRRRIILRRVFRFFNRISTREREFREWL